MIAINLPVRILIFPLASEGPSTDAPTPLGGDCFEEQRIERPGRDAIQHLADMGVGRNGAHAEQGLAV
jgi:hypothetical protein